MKKLKTLQELKEDILAIDVSNLPLSDKDKKEIQREINFTLKFLQEGYDYTKDWDVDEEWVHTRATIVPHTISLIVEYGSRRGEILEWGEEMEYEHRIGDLYACRKYEWYLPKEYFERIINSKYSESHHKRWATELMQTHAV